MAFYDIAARASVADPFGSIRQGQALRQAYDMNQLQLESAKRRAEIEPEMLQLGLANAKLQNENAKMEQQINKMRLENLPQELIDAARARQLDLQNTQMAVQENLRRGAFKMALADGKPEDTWRMFPDLMMQYEGQRMEYANHQIQAERSKLADFEVMRDRVALSDDPEKAYEAGRAELTRIYGAGPVNQFAPKQYDKGWVSNARVNLQGQNDLSTIGGLMQERERLIRRLNAASNNPAEVRKLVDDLNRIDRDYEMAVEARNRPRNTTDKQDAALAAYTKYGLSPAAALNMKDRHANLDKAFREARKPDLAGRRKSVPEALADVEEENPDRLSLLMWKDMNGHATYEERRELRLRLNGPTKVDMDPSKNRDKDQVVKPFEKPAAEKPVVSEQPTSSMWKGDLNKDMEELMSVFGGSLGA